MRKCTLCNKVKNLNEFHFDKRNKLDGRQSRCKDCHKILGKRIRQQNANNRTKQVPVNKVCGSCKTTKPIESFSINIARKDGYSSRCKLCDREQHKLWRSNNRNKTISTSIFGQPPYLNGTTLIFPSATYFYRPDGTYCYIAPDTTLNCSANNGFGTVYITWVNDTVTSGLIFVAQSSIAAYEESPLYEQVGILDHYINERKCTICKFLKPITEFHKDRGSKLGIKNYCKTCAKSHHLKNKYGILPYEFKALIITQENKCAICKSDFTNLKICVDHEHKSGTVRGLLCQKCNLGIAYLQDAEDVLESAIKYLKQKQRKEI